MREIRGERVIREAFRLLGQEFDRVDWIDYDVCECGHRRSQHGRPKNHNGHGPCFRCGCMDFEDAGFEKHPFNKPVLFDSEAYRS